MNPILSNPSVFFPTARAFALKELKAKLNNERPSQPQPVMTLDTDQSSPTFMQEIPTDPGSYVTSTLQGNTPVNVAGRVSMAKALLAAELCVAGSHTISTSAEIEQELARQQSRLTAVQAEDARIKKGAVPFVISLPGQGSK